MKIQFSKWAVGAAIAVGLSFTTAISPVSAKTLRIGNDGKPQSMDPHYISTVQTSRISDDMFEGLLTYGPDGAPVPGAAESWDISEDGLTYTFHLRDAVWSDGVPVTAEDFTYAYKRLLAPEFGGEYASLLYIIEGAELSTLVKPARKPCKPKHWMTRRCRSSCRIPRRISWRS